MPVNRHNYEICDDCKQTIPYLVLGTIIRKALKFNNLSAFSILLV
jgi:hypothetical protein